MSFSRKQRSCLLTNAVHLLVLSLRVLNPVNHQKSSKRIIGEYATQLEIVKKAQGLLGLQ